MNEQTPMTTPAADPADEESSTRPASRHTRIAALSIAAAVLLTAGAGAGAWAAVGGGTTSTTSATGPGTGTGGSSGGSGASGFGGMGSGGFSQGSGSGQGFGGFSQGSGSGQGVGGSSSSVGSTTATAAQSRGVVVITSELGYQDGESAGTGIVLTSSGRILTNNHVVDGATAIRVTDETTGTTYTAEVVGTDATADIAVLQLQDASGLTTAALSSDAAAEGDDVTAVGNAGGTGTLTAAAGTVTGTDQRITTESEGSTQGETLDGLIETDADVVSGDSGGPLQDADGEVVGITTAATSGTADITGYAIPISTALTVAEQIIAGHDTADITIGLPAFLGVSIDTEAGGTAGATVGSVLSGTAAAGTDLAAGDVITAVGGTQITSSDALSAAIAEHAPGDRVAVTWTDSSGASHTATVVLTEGPAD